MNAAWKPASCLLALAALLAPARAQVCPEKVGPDVVAGSIDGLVNFTVMNGLDAVSAALTACNLGDVSLPVQASSNQHYLLTQNLYRYKDMGGWHAFEQVGLSWVRHAFFALNTAVCCETCVHPGTGAELGPGCSDPLAASGNADPVQLRPRWQIDAHDGAFPFPQANPPLPAGNGRRLEVALADLAPSAGGTHYFLEAHYVDPADAAAGHQDDNASFRELALVGSGTVWNFSLQGDVAIGRSAIEAWRDQDPLVELRDVRVGGEGRLVLASRVTELGGGTWHYEYALHNMNSHDSVRGFALPLPVGVAVSDIGFHDVQYRHGDGEGGVDRDGTDWAVASGGGELAWSTSTFADDPNANALRWSTTYNFRFDAGVPPATGTLRLELYRSGGTLLVPDVQVPGAASPFGSAFCNASDGAHALCPCSNEGYPQSGCDLAQATGGLRLVASAFAPDGAGGGSATFQGEGFPSGASPAVMLIRSTARESPPIPFGDGLRCLVASGLLRVASGLASGGAIELSLSHGAGAGDFAYQIWARNQPAAFCNSAAFNLSNGLELDW